MDIVLRAAVLYFFIVLVTRIVGRRELSSLSALDLILLIVLGDAVQQGLTQDDYSITGAVLVIGTIAVLQVCVSYLGFKFPLVRPILEGEPVVLVENGNVIARNLERERLTRSELAEAARKEQIESIADVKWAVLETNGEISFIKKEG